MAHAKILILDDDRLIAELLGELLSLAGHTVTTSTRPAEALEFLAHNRFDVILTDFCMPQMNGRQFYEAVVEAYPQTAGRVIFLTGDYLNGETESWTLEVGAKCLAKPFTLKTLHSTVAEVLTRTCVPV